MGTGPTIRGVYPRGSMHTTAAARAICFGPYQVDPRTRELRKGRRRIRVPDQSMRILLALLDRAGDVVTRDDLAAILWPHDTSVDIEHGLNSAVRRLRDSIGDSVDRPAYIETVPRIGYGSLESSSHWAPPWLRLHPSRRHRAPIPRSQQSLPVSHGRIHAVAVIWCSTARGETPRFCRIGSILWAVTVRKPPSAPPTRFMPKARL